jgi:hypothetical protein
VGDVGINGRIILKFILRKKGTSLVSRSEGNSSAGPIILKNKRTWPFRLEVMRRASYPSI